jgi:hypothetical protein
MSNIVVASRVSTEFSAWKSKHRWRSLLYSPNGRQIFTPDLVKNSYHPRDILHLVDWRSRIRLYYTSLAYILMPCMVSHGITHCWAHEAGALLLKRETPENEVYSTIWNYGCSMVWQIRPAFRGMSWPSINVVIYNEMHQHLYYMRLNLL